MDESYVQYKQAMDQFREVHKQITAVRATIASYGVANLILRFLIILGVTTRYCKTASRKGYYCRKIR